MDKPAWIIEAEKYIGLKEIKGPEHSPEILQWWKDIKRGGIKDDETAYCAAFVGAMLERSGIKSSRFESARSYLQWGEPLPEAVYGCIVVLSRPGAPESGHTGFPVGKDEQGRIMVLGANQNDTVSIAPFNIMRVLAYRWPSGEPLEMEPLPLITSNASSSTNEA